MVRMFIIAVSSAAFLTLSNSAFAQQGQFGTADDARAMLLKAVAAVKADRDLALGMFNRGEGGFRDRDLYVLCFRAEDGKMVANGAGAVAIGTDQRTIRDPTGRTVGQENYAAVQKPEGQITEIGGYLFPRPGTTAPAVPKAHFVTRVSDLGCAVGYFK